MVKFIQVGGTSFIGDLQPGNNRLKNPRIIVWERPAPNVIALNLFPVIGEPPEIEIHEKLYSYEVGGEVLRKYIEVTTGIVIANPSRGKMQ